MDFNRIDGFLDKFKKLLTQGEAAHTTIAEVIHKHTKIALPLSAIKTKATVIYIQGSPMLRSEVLMRKEEILKELQESIPERRFTQIY